MAPRGQDHAGAGPDDFTVFVVLICMLFFLVFMLSLPMWFSSFVRSLGG